MIATINAFKVAKRNFPVILGLFTLYFLMTYSEGLHAGVRFFRYHYVLLAFMTAYFFVDSIHARQRLYFVELGMGPKIACLLFLLQIINASIFGGRAHITAIHVVIWHVWSYVFFVILFSRYGSRNNTRGLVISCVGTYLLACVALGVGLYMKYIGEIHVAGLTFTQSIYRGVDYRRLTSWCTSPNRTGPLFLYGIVTGLFIYVMDSSKRRRQMIVIGMIALAFGIVLSGSRSAIISTVAMLGFSAIFAIRMNLLSGRRISGAMIVTIFMMIGIAVVVLIQREDAVGQILDYTRLEDSILVTSEGIAIVGREYVHESALDVHRTAPLHNQLFGVGPGGILDETGMSSHSGWLNVFVEEGIVGAIVLLFVFTAITWNLYKVYSDRKSSQLLRMLSGIQISFWVSFALLNVTTAIMPVPRADSFFMCMMLAMHAYCGKLKADENIEHSRRKLLNVKVL